MEKKTMLRADEIRRRLRDRNLSAVAREAKVSRPVLYQIMREDTDPRYSTVERLSDYLEDLS
jgi:DNA-binding phage protein